MVNVYVKLEACVGMLSYRLILNVYFELEARLNEC